MCRDRLNKLAYVLILVFAVALLIRLYPTMISGEPFSTDGWGPIRNAQLLLQYTPVSLGNNTLFDGYNSYWPANSIFGAIFSQVTGTSVINAMAIGIPLAGALTIPLFFVLVRKITENTKIALIAAALLATAYPFTMFTAGVTKETFADPIYVSVILIFLLAPSWKRTVLFSVASVALALSQHLTTFITIGVLTALTIASFYSKDERLRNSAKSSIGLLGIISAVTAAYFAVYAYKGVPLTFTTSELLTIAAYQLVALAIVMFFTARAVASPSSKRVTLWSAATFILSCSFMLLLTRKSLISGAPALPLNYFLYAIPYIIALPLMMLGLAKLHERRSAVLLPLFWLVPLIGLEGYAIFGGFPLGLTLSYRTLDFLLLPLLILVSIALYKLYVYSKRMRIGRILSVGVIATILFMASVNSYSMFASVSLQEQYMGYFWLYREPEIAASSWIAANGCSLTVAGDMKVSYLVDGYFNVKVNVLQGLEFLEGNGSAPELLFVYPEMYTNGYVLYMGNVLSLPGNWTNQLTSLNCVYSNNMVSLYAK
jgi:hypothetical protein